MYVFFCQNHSVGLIFVVRCIVLHREEVIIDQPDIGRYLSYLHYDRRLSEYIGATNYIPMLIL